MTVVRVLDIIGLLNREINRTKLLCAGHIDDIKLDYYKEFRVHYSSMPIQNSRSKQVIRIYAKIKGVALDFYDVDTGEYEYLVSDFEEVVNVNGIITVNNIGRIVPNGDLLVGFRSRECESTNIVLSPGIRFCAVPSNANVINLCIKTPYGSRKKLLDGNPYAAIAYDNKLMACKALNSTIFDFNPNWNGARFGYIPSRNNVSFAFRQCGGETLLKPVHR